MHYNHVIHCCCHVAVADLYHLITALPLSCNCQLTHVILKKAVILNSHHGIQLCMWISPQVGAFNRDCCEHSCRQEHCTKHHS